MDLVIETAKKTSLSFARIFGLSYEYAENRCCHCVVIAAYREWHMSGDLPEEVKSYCLDILANRTFADEVIA